MEEMKTITLDFTGCRNKFEMHEVIKVAFDFPDWYGRNWSAFWDLLDFTSGVVVEVRGINSLPEDWKSSGDKVIELLQRNKEYVEQFNKRNPQFDYQFDYTVID